MDIEYIFPDCVSLRAALGLFFYPLVYHADLQRLGLISAQPYLPPWSAFNPFSCTSPLTPLSLYYDQSTSFAECIKACLTSPAVVACAEQLLERWLYATINEAVETSVICPDNPDIASPEIGHKHRLLTTLGLRRPSPPLVRRAIEKLMLTTGWGTPAEPIEASPRLPPEVARSGDSIEGQTIEVAGTTVRNVAALDLEVVRSQGEHAPENLDLGVVALQFTAVDESDRPTTPVSPSVSVLRYDDDDDDPRIRITSREGIVEMEVRLPPHVLSSHTEVADALASAQGYQDEAKTRHDGPQHRVSQLSMAPSDKISGVVKAHLVGLAVLPLRLVLVRLVASHYLAGSGGNAGVSRGVVPLPRIWNSGWRSIGIQVSRLALCSVVHLAIDLGLWGGQYVLALNLGKSLFGWGTI